MEKSIDYKVKARTNGVFFVEWSDEDGKRKRVSLGTSDKRTANAKAKEVFFGAKSNGAKTSGVTMADLFDRCRLNIWSPEEYRSQQTIKSNIKILKGYIGSEQITAVDYHRLDKLKDELKADDYANGSIHRMLTTVGASLTRACIERYPDGRPWLVGRPPLPKVPKGRHRERTVSFEEQRAILGAITNRACSETTRDWTRFYILIEFLLATSCRLGETLKMKLHEVEVIDIDGRDVHVATLPAENTKSDKTRAILLTKHVYNGLQTLRFRAVGGRFFPWKPSTAWYMWATIRSDVKAMGYDISDVVLHTMRHTALSRLASKGGDIHGIQKWAGHSSPNITSEIYVHTQVRDQLGMLDIMERISAGAA